MKYLKFSENLRESLNAHEITQQTLADRLGTTQATISRWLNGVNEPDFSTLIDICLFLNETPNSLLGFDEIPESAFSACKNSNPDEKSSIRDRSQSAFETTKKDDN